MTTFAYLRVSTDQQDLDNQRHGILEYANNHRLGPLEFVEDAVSGRVGWRERAVGELLLETASEEDLVLFAEVSRMGRSTLQVLEMLETCMKRGLTVHIAKQRMVLDSSMQSRITATVLGLAAEIERELISQRTTEALARRKAAGKPLGRPKGRTAISLKLDPNGSPSPRPSGSGVSVGNDAHGSANGNPDLFDWHAKEMLVGTTVCRLPWLA